MPERSLQIDGVPIVVHDTATGVIDAALREVQRLRDGLLCFATGSTFAPMVRRLTDEVRFATHLDEYLGFPPDRAGGMVHELITNCPPVAAMLRDGRFWPVPHREDQAAIAAHEQRVLDRGVDLQLLGIGRNGHIAFNEPGTAFDLGYHATSLADVTRDDARARFAPDEPPRRAITSGPRTICAAQRIVLAATGPRKARAVAAMLRGPIDPACPASILRRHGNVIVLLDRDAAAELEAAEAGEPG